MSEIFQLRRNTKYTKYYEIFHNSHNSKYSSCTQTAVAVATPTRSNNRTLLTADDIGGLHSREVAASLLKAAPTGVEVGVAKRLEDAESPFN